MKRSLTLLIIFNEEKKVMEIRNLSKIDFSIVFQAFSRAFANYEVQINEEQLESMLKRRGFNPEFSFAAFDKNQIVAFTFNGIGNFNEIATAYDTGTGTLEEYRGKGLATNIFEHSIPYLREIGIKQYLLEVLQHNASAVSIYKNIGFRITREFNYFMQKNEKISNEIRPSKSPYFIKQINLYDFHLIIPTFWDFYPSWQNSIESIIRTPKDFIYMGAFADNELMGYCVFEPISGDITQIAVDKDNRRKGIASSLLNEMIRLNRHEVIKVINTDISCNSITAFLRSKNIEIAGKQFEMMKEI